MLLVSGAHTEQQISIENISILSNDSKLVSSSHFQVLHAFPQYQLDQQFLDAYSMAGAVQYVEISEITKILSHFQGALNLFDSPNHLPPQKVWALKTKAIYPLYSHSLLSILTRLTIPFSSLT